jgi:hypothetical protein
MRVGRHHQHKNKQSYSAGVVECSCDESKDCYDDGNAFAVERRRRKWQN